MNFKEIDEARKILELGETADKEIDEEHLKNFYDGWITDFEKSADAGKHKRRGEK